MSIRFKFRSAVNYDSVDIEGRSSISVGDLKSKIVHQKKLNLSQDIDLVFSDAITGREYNDDKFHILSGSAVVIKRVPAGAVRSTLMPDNTAVDFAIKEDNRLNAANGTGDNVADIGVELGPVPVAILPESESDLEFGHKNCRSNDIEYIAGSRSGCQKLHANEFNDAIPRGSIGKETGHTLCESKLEENLKLQKDQRMVNASFLTEQIDAPPEFKCPLCDRFFKEAVMIPCCQHSFCEKCIRLVLTEKARCPKCSSSKCKVEDLLPNVSLRRTIDHFLQSQMLNTCSNNAMHAYAPDGESGILAKEASCAVTILQREPELPHSPCMTEKGSNEILEEPVHESLTRKKLCTGGTGYHLKYLDGGPEYLAPHADFQGENRPLMPQTQAHDEAESNIRQRSGLWADTRGGNRSFMAASRHQKGYRACYMCGSPDHLIRNCPVAASQRPMIGPGNALFPGAMSAYESPYWNDSSLPPMRPFTNMYGNLGVMPFNANMVPVMPFSVPRYIPSIYGGLPASGGYMRTGVMTTPVGKREELPLSHTAIFDLEDREVKRKLEYESLEREQDFDDERDVAPHKYRKQSERSYRNEHHIEREGKRNFGDSEDSFNQRLQRKIRRDDKHLDHDNYSIIEERHAKSPRSSTDKRDWRCYHSERSDSAVEDASHSYEKHSGERHKHHHRTSKKDTERRMGHCVGDSTRDFPQTQMGDVKRRRNDEFDVKGSRGKHQIYSESGWERSHSGDDKRRCKQTECTHGSRHYRHGVKPPEERCSDRWDMASGSDEEWGEGFRHHKRKRVQ